MLKLKPQNDFYPIGFVTIFSVFYINDVYATIDFKAERFHLPAFSMIALVALWMKTSVFFQHLVFGRFFIFVSNYLKKVRKNAF